MRLCRLCGVSYRTLFAVTWEHLAQDDAQVSGFNGGIGLFDASYLEREKNYRPYRAVLINGPLPTCSLGPAWVNRLILSQPTGVQTGRAS